MKQSCIPQQTNNKFDLKAKIEERKLKRPLRISNFKKQKKQEIKIKTKQQKHKPAWMHPSDRINDYQLLGQIGQGGYAQVLLGIKQNQQKQFAIKIYDKLKLPKPSKLKSIYREIEVMNILKYFDHPYIIKMIEWREGVSLIYIILEYCKGGSLWDKQKLKQKQLKPIIKQLVQALLFLQKNGIAHRDIKAENILFHKGKVKLIDFGFALFASKDQLITTYCGTPTYMAPQIVTRTPHSPYLSDRWSLGILIYLMINGDYPFLGQDEQTLFAKICTNNVVFKQKLSQEVEDLINKLLVKDCHKRITYEGVLLHPWIVNL